MDKLDYFSMPLIVESTGDDEFAGSIETEYFLLTTVAGTISELIENMRYLIADFFEHEGKSISYWISADVNDIPFEVEHDVTSLFDVFDSLKVNSIANLAGINPSLMRQYASGVKYPSEKQAKKIEAAVRELGERLLKVTIS